MAESIEVDIMSLGAQGEGVADLDGRTIYVPGTLPGERVVLRAASSDHATPIAVLRASPDRIAPVCRHFGACGGCQLQHMARDAYLAWKRELVIDAFAARGLDVDPAPVVAIPPGSRRRAVLAAQQHDRRTLFGFHAARSHEIVALEQCPVVVPAIERALPDLGAIITPLAGGQEQSRLSVTALSNGLDVGIDGIGKQVPSSAITAIGAAAARAGIVRVSLDSAPLYLAAMPFLTLGSAKVTPPPGAFIQASAEAEADLVERTLRAVGKSKTVTDLFCGIGTFTFHLARRARVLAIDSDAASIAALQTAARAAPGLKPIETRRRDLFGDPLSPLELNAFDAVVFDPPRAGAAAQAGALARSKVKTVVAVSCNPATMARDVRILVDGGYRLESLTPIDQFVYSAHIEAIAILRR